jgi:hypothetical protein
MIMSRFPGPAHLAEMTALVHASRPRQLSFNFLLEMEADLPLAAGLMPELLYLIDDSACRPFVVKIAGDLAENNLLSAPALKPYEAAILEFARVRIADLSTDIGSPRTWDAALITILGMLNSPGSQAAIREYFETEFHDLRVKAFATLFRNGKQTDEDIRSLAADKTTRLDLYRILLKAGRLSKMPREFFTQEMFSESEVYAKAMEFELEPPALIDQQVTKLIDMGPSGKKRFFFYRMKSANGLSFLACAGPYAPDASKVDLAHTPAVIDYQHLYDPVHQEAQMMGLLARRK